jgi:L-rhamnonate dehydratase
LKISAVHLLQVEGVFDQREFHGVERSVGPLDLYPEHRNAYARAVTAEEVAAPQPISGIYLRIETDEGLYGLAGPLMPVQAFLIDMHFRSFLIGHDPLAVERIWDVLSRHDRHARRGSIMMAVSAVDIALWDIRGKAAGMPIYRLLGGPTRDAIPAYASCLGFSLEPEAVHQRARALEEEGFVAEKWFFRYGPGHGRGAIEKNMELVRAAREAVGEDVDLMFDAWLGWDVPFAIEMGRAMAPYHPRWLEEPVPPDRISSYAEIREKTGIPISGGEHEYTRWGFKVLLDAGGVDVVQADPEWTGGITELVKICALSSAYGRQVVPHGHTALPALHVVASQSPEVCPLFEYLLIHGERIQYFHKYRVKPEKGLVHLPQVPGLGLELDETRITAQRELTWR